MIRLVFMALSDTIAYRSSLMLAAGTLLASFACGCADRNNGSTASTRGSNPVRAAKRCDGAAPSRRQAVDNSAKQLSPALVWTELGTDDETHFQIYSRSSDDGKMTLRFENASGNVFALNENPKTREPVLDRGKWLIVAAAEWSPSDWMSVLRAARFAASTHGSVNVGVRPFRSYEEITNWCPEYDLRDGGYRSPQWVALTDGKVCGIDAGELTMEQLVAFAAKARLIRSDDGAANAEQPADEN